MAFKTTPTLNRIKHNKGWKNNSFPSKKNIYTRDTVLYLKIHLLITAYFTLNRFKLIRCHFYAIENNHKSLQIIIMRDIKWKVKKKRKFSPDSSQLFFPQQHKAIHLLYKAINKKKGKLLIEKIGIRKIKPSRHWVAKPRIFTWTSFFRKRMQARQQVGSQNNKYFLKHQHLKKWRKRTYGKLLKKKIRDNLLLENYIQIFRKSFINQRSNQAPIKKVLHIYKQLKKHLQQRYITTLKIAYNFRRQKNFKTQAKLNQKNYHDTTLSFYTTITKSIIRGKNKTYLNELKNIIKNMVRLQFKNARGIKEKSLRSYNYPKTQNYKIHTKNSRKHYYIFDNIFYLLEQLQKLKSANERGNYFYWQRIWLLKTINTAYGNKRKFYKFRLIKKTAFPRVIKLFKSTRFKKKTGILQLNWEKIKLTAREIILHNSQNIYDELEDDEKYLPSKFGGLIKNHTSDVKFLQKIDTKHNIKQKLNSLKYRVQYRTNYKKFVTFATKQYLKHIISNFLQNYFKLKFNIILTNIGNSLYNKKYHYVCFPSKKNNNKQSNVKNRTRKKMKFQNLIIKTQKNKRAEPTQFLGINDKASHFVNNIYDRNKKKELKQMRANIQKAPQQHTQLIKKVRRTYVASLKKIVIFKQKLKIIATKKQLNFLKKISIKKGKTISPPLTFTKDMSILSRTNRFKATMNIVYLFAKYMEPKILVNYIIKLLEVTKKHWQAITKINQLLKDINSNKNLVYRIGIFGRFNSTEKAKKIYFNMGNMQAQTFSKKVNFAYAQSRPSIGAIGVKIWTYL